MPPEIEQRHLLELAANALGFDQAMRAIALAGHGVEGLCFANIHAARIIPKAGSRKTPAQILWHYNRVFSDSKRKNAGFGGVLGGNLGVGC